MVKLFVSAMLVAMGVLAMASPTAAQQVACSARASPGDTAVGIDLITDASCVSGGLGCLGTVCRFCKLKETPASGHLLSCPTTTTAPPPAPVAASASCSALLAPGDKAVGISIASDAACSTRGGVGCIGGSACRFCRVLETPQSKHLPLCSAILSPAASTESSNAVKALEMAQQASTATGDNVATAKVTPTAVALPIGVAVAAAVAVVGFAAKRARDRAADDSLVTPTNMIHRNEPLCTL